ncbi:NAD(P)-dependent alcohol dehydrogenase [Demequina sp.]|uniref:NAD(P)-dependent alcohol dehydrogenase n=1 Tax=Demequina sp. TaxID=2050685 RepID=UPI0025EC3A26|nr:NAD(P)-dependent alcohol dehydrogenase [Demequina sp.]
MTTTTTTTMTAVTQRRYGGPDTLETAAVPIPVPGPHDVLIRVEAAALNPADAYLMRGIPRVVRLAAGLRRPRRPVRGTDAAGTVVAVGDSVAGFRRGDRVFGEARGSLAQYAVADQARIARLPHDVPAEAAAASVMAGLAALHGLRAARLEAGHTLLVNGASGGIGHLALQIATAQGAIVTGVCSTANVPWVSELGAQRVVDRTGDSVLDLAERFDVVFDNVGDHRVRDLLAITADGGTVVSNSGAQGADGGPMRRMALARWLNLTTRDRRIVTYYSSPRRADLETLARMLAEGTLQPHIGSRYGLRDAADAMDRVESRHPGGKVVLTP